MGHSTRLLLETPEEPQSQTASNLRKAARAIQGNAWGGVSNTKAKVYNFYPLAVGHDQSILSPLTSVCLNPGSDTHT